MSCKSCDEFQQGNQTSYFRWKNANIEIRACEQHLREIFDALKEAQRMMELESEKKVTE